MNFKLRINGKMLLYILGLTAMIYAGSLGYVSYKLYNVSSNNAKGISQAVAHEYANEAIQAFNTYAEAAFALAKTFSNINVIDEEQRRSFALNAMLEIIENNSDILSVWSNWEPNTIDQLDSLSIGIPGSTYIGSFSPSYYQVNREIIMKENSSTTLFEEQYFKDVKGCECPLLLEPYYYSYSGIDSILQTNIVVPIFNDNEFVGVVGIDIPLAFFQKTFAHLKPLGSGHIYIISNQGIIVSSPDSTMINKSFEDLAPELVQTHDLLTRISMGYEFNINDQNVFLNEKSLFAFKPLFIGETKLPWSVCVTIPMQTIFKQSNKSLALTILIGLIGLIVLTIAIMMFSKTISKPIIAITNSLKLLARGNINSKGKVKYRINDEIGDLAKSVNDLYDGLNSATNFANEIGKGNLQTEYKLLSHNDELGSSLLQMQKSLLIAKEEEEKKKILDANRNWVTHGLAKFGEIIRQDNDDMEKFAKNVVRELAEYMNVAQVALFINEANKNDDGESCTFTLKAAIAYGKLVMLEKTVNNGDELLGRAADENKIIHLKNIPQGYVDISPGMQDKSRPDNLLISPLSTNDVTYGIIEVLSYSQFLDFQLEFIERLSENIASVISSVQINIRTARLLEQSRQQADELAQHEEEMRQNLEEMQATQEEASKRQTDLSTYIKAVKKSMMMAQLDVNGRVLDMSPAMLLAYGISIESVQGRYYDAFVAQTEELRTVFTEFWEKLLKNGKGRRNYIIEQRNKKLYILEEYLVLKQDGSQPKILLIAINQTKEKELNLQLQKEKRALKKKKTSKM